MTAVMPRAQFNDVVKTYGSRVVVDHCTFAVAPGEVLGLVGPNGAGKTTLARMLAGFMQPTSGEVSIDGTKPRAWRIRNGIGYLPEELPRPWSCSVAQLIRIRADAEVNDVLSVLGFVEPDHRSISKLSKGQWRLVLTAFAMLGVPALVILDEPDSGMDPDSLDRIQEAVRRCAGAGSSVVILSHNLETLQSVCGRVLFLRKGALVGEVDHESFTRTSLRELYREVMGDPLGGKVSHEQK